MMYITNCVVWCILCVMHSVLMMCVVICMNVVCDGVWLALCMMMCMCSVCETEEFKENIADHVEGKCVCVVWCWCWLVYVCVLNWCCDMCLMCVEWQVNQQCTQHSVHDV